MALKKTELLLLHNVEHLGIVGDVVKVRTGYARNYLVPMGLAEVPTEERITELQADREAALAQVKARREAREALITRMDEVELTLVRSCNAQGVLYGSVTQRDISDALQHVGFEGVDTRAVRLHQAIRRIGEYPVTIQFDKDLRTEVMIVVEPDQPLEEREEMEFDDEGNLIEKPEVEAEAPAVEPEEATADAAQA
ncbi:MAG: 50S ribosomal protein L9 [Phycisphaerales bacterium]|nr:50S ribosomal protein L9 [Phycisphaerales bacterium]